MAINVTAANQQAAEIAAKITQLKTARNALHKYRTELLSNWQSIEVDLFLESIDAEIRKIDILMRSLQDLSNDIRNTAAEIHREEEAAAQAAAAQAARQRQQARARSAYNEACAQLDTIAKERDKIIQQMRNTKSLKTMISLNEKLIEIDKKLSDAQQVCERCRLALG